MRAEQFISDPVFQVNLLIWMALEQPDSAFRVRPLFFQCGFGILYIEQPFAFPVDIHQQIDGTTKVRIASRPEPDLLLAHRNQEKALYFEAKRSCFGPVSSSADQARGHLIAAGPAFGEVYKGKDDCLLVYVVPSSNGKLMAECLRQLSGEITDLGFRVGRATVDGLAVNDASVLYQVSTSSAQHIGIEEQDVAVIEGLTEDTDPSPLLLVYSDEDYPDEAGRGFYRKALQNQVVARMLCDLQHAAIRQDLLLNARDLLIKTSARVFEFLGRERQTAMERLVVQNVFKRVAEYWAERIPSPVRIQLREAKFHFADEDQKEEFLDWLENWKKTNFADTKPSVPTQGELFKD